MYKRGPESICTPPSSEWPHLLAGNQTFLSQSAHSLAALRQRFRTELHEAATAFEQKVAALAKSASIPWQTPLVPDEDSGIVMAGHQPVIYHCGLAEKTKLLASAVRNIKLQGYNIIIDTDAGDSGQILFPSQAGTLQSRSISSGGELMLHQGLRGQSEIADVFRCITDELQSLGKSDTAQRVKEAAELYSRLANTPTVVANSLLRRVWEGPRPYREVPLSAVAALPSAKEFIAAIVADGAEFHCSYNLALETHRANHRIKNVANPFPNLKSDGMRDELPLWRIAITAQSRLPYFAPAESSDSSPEELLAPRGALITTMLRFLGADLFIHGLGGATYEPVTDLLLSGYFALSGTAYVIASANRYLFTEQITSHEEALACAESLKSIPTRIPQFLNQGLFTAEQEQSLAKLHQRRVKLVAALQMGKENRLDVRQVGVELKGLDSEIRDFLATTALAERAKSATVTPSILNQWYCRTLPYFFFATDECLGL